MAGVIIMGCQIARDDDVEREPLQPLLQHDTVGGTPSHLDFTLVQHILLGLAPAHVQLGDGTDAYADRLALLSAHPGRNQYLEVSKQFLVISG
jgi:hypothetical protein